MDRDLKRSIILDNYQNPNMKHTSNEDYVKINTRNVSCIDNLDIYLKRKSIQLLKLNQKIVLYIRYLIQIELLYIQHYQQ